MTSKIDDTLHSDPAVFRLEHARLYYALWEMISRVDAQTKR